MIKQIAKGLLLMAAVSVLIVGCSSNVENTMVTGKPNNVTVRPQGTGTLPGSGAAPGGRGGPTRQ